MATLYWVLSPYNVEIREMAVGLLCTFKDNAVYCLDATASHTAQQEIWSGYNVSEHLIEGKRNF